MKPTDLPGDPGLEVTPLANTSGPYVGAAVGPIPRFAEDDHLDRLLHELAQGFGPQTWWPAETPFEVIVGAVLTQNTAWSNVELALRELKRQVPLTPAHLCRARRRDLETWIRSSGTYRAKAEKLARVSHWYLEVGGLRTLRESPLDEIRAELLSVWGVGPETADSILCYAAGRPTAIVDAYTRRVLARHGLGDAEAPYEELRSWLMERLVPVQIVYEEFHALCVRVGYRHCKPSALCESCPATAPVKATS